MTSEPALLGILRNPNELLTLPPHQQAQVLRQARLTGLLGFLATRLNPGTTNQKLADHLTAGKVYAEFHDRMITWEINRLGRALETLAGPIVLLKGAAYRMAELSLARGRLSSDVDILVPKEQLEATEQALLDAGWVHAKEEDYDQRYYREWMHELPPLRHRERGTVVDLHHNILPPTARLKPDARKLLAAAQPIGEGGFYVLCPQDSVLHKAAHLFFDGDLKNGLRELLDLHELMNEYGRQPQFWQGIVSRAHELELSRPLYYAVHCCQRLLHTEVPPEIFRELHQDAPPYPIRPIMHRLLLIMLHPPHPDRRDLMRNMASWLLFLRSHWLRMPPLLLARHLITQVVRRGGLRTG